MSYLLFFEDTARHFCDYSSR